MVVQHNIAALNAYRQFGTNTTAVSKNLEKLSSGYAINRAGDDASGLAISEKMRAQISGLQVAQKNAQDGISLVQTAEGALTEVHSMLNRMVELAEKSANGTIQNTVDRAAIQKETDDIISEIDRISKSTNFNGINLLDGTLGGVADTEASLAASGATAITVSGGNFTGAAAATTFSFTGNVATQSSSTLTGGPTGVTFRISKTTGDETGGSITFVADIDDTQATAADKEIFEGLSVTVNHNQLAAGTSTSTVAANAAGGGLKLQIGDSDASYQKVTVAVDDLSAKGLKLDGLDVSTQAAAGDSIQKIKDAINQVSTNRGNLGGLQNRLEYTINNLSVTEENMTAAESSIRDTDMAAEMMAYTKNNVLTQAAQAMLAQANTQPQSVLQLLQ